MHAVRPVRITADGHAAVILWPAFKAFLPGYPDVKVEVVIDYGITDIVAERFDVGIRLGGFTMVANVLRRRVMARGLLCSRP